MNNSLLSVIIPVYNAESTIQDCINSILSQTYSPIEIILVDDGSKDDSPALCDKLAAKDTRIKVVHQENGGPNSARNRGIETSRGEYLVFVDADDEFYSDDTLDVNMRFFDEDDAIDVVSFPQYREKENRDGYNIKAEQFSPKIIDDKKEMLVNWFNGRLIDGHFPGKIFRKSLFEGWRLIETIRFTEDHYNIPDLVERCRKVYISGVGGYKYSCNPNSLIHSEYNLSKRFGQFSSECRLYQYLQQFDDVNEYKRDFYIRALENAYYLMGSHYEADVLHDVKSLKPRLLNGMGGLQKLLMVMTRIFGMQKGIVYTKRIFKLLKR